MRYSSYHHSRSDDWEYRIRRALRAERGFPWTAFILGLVLGAVIF